MTLKAAESLLSISNSLILIQRGLKINNFNTMDSSQLTESPQIHKISKTSQQFRQLIESLRRNAHQPALAPRSQSALETKIDSWHKQDASTAVLSESKMFQHTNSLTKPNQADVSLRFKPKMEVGDRDKLKKRSIHLDHNPEHDQLSKERSIKDLNLSLPEQSKEYINTGCSPMSPVKNASTQYDGFFQPKEPSSHTTSRSQGTNGRIVKQAIIKEESCEYKAKSQRNVKDIEQATVLSYLQRQTKLHQKSDPSQIFNFFTNLCLSCDVIIKTPSIKKYRNCVYFGHTINKQAHYEGFLYFYDGKIYFGQFMNGFKHGLGVQLTPSENLVVKGQFKQGHKTGKFYLEKPNQKYIGFLQNGLYQGEGRLTTEDYVYEGLFQKGEKNGYGEQIYPKTGVKLSGTFRNGVLLKTKQAKSIPEFRSKNKISFGKPKQKSKQKLEDIRKKSFDKHNQRMNKIRNPSRKESEYEIQFDDTEDYQQPQKLQVNQSKLEMYRQPPQRLPKICQQFEYSFENDRNFASISSHHGHGRRPSIKQHRQLGFNQLPDRVEKNSHPRIAHERVGTSQLQQPLPTPCLSIYKRKR